jgi:hypothetical protein
MNNTRQIIEQYGAVHLAKVIPIEFCHFFTHALLRKADMGENGDGQVPNAKAIIAHDIMFETLHERLWNVIENVYGEELLPTYSYSRLYSNGDVLEKHTDRFACEISATIQLGRSHHYAWSIYMGGKRFDMAEGDMIVYRGCDIEHWREPCNGPDEYYSGQLFIHFVKKNGQHNKEAGDPTIRDVVSFVKNRTLLMENK